MQYQNNNIMEKRKETINEIFKIIVNTTFEKCNEIVANQLLKAYNTYQENECDGVDYLFDFENKDDLICCIKGGLTATEIANLIATYNSGDNNNYTTLFFFGCNYETPKLITIDEFKNLLLGYASEIVRSGIEFPFSNFELEKVM